MKIALKCGSKEIAALELRQERQPIEIQLLIGGREAARKAANNDAT